MFIWDEEKRQPNLIKHKLDFADATLVYDNPAKLTRRAERYGEQRYVDIAIVQVHGICLTLVYAERPPDIRVISFRRASRAERNLLTDPRQ